MGNRSSTNSFIHSLPDPDSIAESLMFASHYCVMTVIQVFHPVGYGEKKNHLSVSLG